MLTDCAAGMRTFANVQCINHYDALAVSAHTCHTTCQRIPECMAYSYNALDNNATVHVCHFYHENNCHPSHGWVSGVKGSTRHS